MEKENSKIICSKFTFNTDGTPEGTHVLADTHELTNIKSCQINYDKEDTSVGIVLEDTDSEDTVHIKVVVVKGGSE